MAFSETDREELRDIFSRLSESVQQTLENDRVLPASVTHNGEAVGIKINFYKLTSMQAQAVKGEKLVGETVSFKIDDTQYTGEVLEYLPNRDHVMVEVTSSGGVFYVAVEDIL